MILAFIATMFLTAPNGSDSNWDCKYSDDKTAFCLDVRTAPKDRSKPFFVQGLYVDDAKKEIAKIEVRFDCKAGTVELFGDDGTGKMVSVGTAYKPKPNTLSAGHLEDFCPGSI
jgi:hypothetical protein